MKVGDYVWIRRDVKIFRKGKNEIDIQRKKGFVHEEGEEGGFWVWYYGEPHHFTTAKSRHGLYSVLFNGEELEPRAPDFDDPLEFKRCP